MSAWEPLLVAAGAAVGAPLRHWLGLRWAGPRHAGTLLANLVASLLLGLCTGLALDGHLLALLGTGFCGGLSTWSTLAVQAHDDGPGAGAAYVGLTVALGLAAFAGGFAAGAAPG